MIADSLERTDVPVFRVSKVLATPSVRKMAMDNKVNLESVVGSGKDGRILKEDILSYISFMDSKLVPHASSTPNPERRNK